LLQRRASGPKLARSADATTLNSGRQPVFRIVRMLFSTVCVENRVWQGVKAKFQKNLRAEKFSGGAIPLHCGHKGLPARSAMSAKRQERAVGILPP
jgi:hypothetical protein